MPGKSSCGMMLARKVCGSELKRCSRVCCAGAVAVEDPSRGSAAENALREKWWLLTPITFPDTHHLSRR